MKPKRPDGITSYFRRMYHFMRRASPHLALMGIYLMYLVVGAFIFSALENDASSDDYHKKMDKSKEEIKAIFMNVTNDEMNVDEGKRMFDESLDQFTKMMTNSEWKEGRIQSMMVNRTFDTFSSSMLFCMTTITTIGYGDIVPTTAWGRTFCIIYALIGIPLTLLCLADLGDLLARLVLWTCRKLGINRCTRRINDECSRSRPKDDFATSHHHDHMSDTTSMPGSFKKVESTGEKSLQEVDLTETSMNAHHEGGHVVEMNGESSGTRATVHHHHQHGVCTKEGGCQEEEVPVLVIVFLLVTYVCLGSTIVAVTEEWSYGNAIYFTIITLTTIGFGDFVPTQLYARKAFLLQICFTLLGMAMMSMTIALLKNKVIRIFTYLYNKLNIK